jgi:hypothetical protein
MNYLRSCDAKEIKEVVRRIRMENEFICPECNTRVIRTNHYMSILQAQNLVNMLMGNRKITDMCVRCNHFIYED